MTRSKAIKDNLIPRRRFGRTELQMPVLSLGGMRFQQSWKDLDPKEINNQQQNILQKTIEYASAKGLHHLETARHYGTSELQIGWALEHIDDPKRILQTKIPPNNDPLIFEQELDLSLRRLGSEKIDLLAIHGINLPEHLDMTIRPNGCLEIVRRWQKDGLIGHIGFSTHAHVDLIIKTIETGFFDYVNLHWYYINQKNSKVIELAHKYDLGVFIISPTDKGGHLHTPSSKMIDLCRPLHPIVFNDLFCLRNNNIHTISIGIAEEEDFDLHLEAVSLLPESDNYIPKILNNLEKESINSLGLEWVQSWDKNLPNWQNTPGGINIPVLLWLSNLIDSFDLEGFAKSRYQLLGNGSHWFPGNNANSLDNDIPESQLLTVLERHNNPKKVIWKLRSLKEKFGEKSLKRLSKN